MAGYISIFLILIFIAVSMLAMTLIVPSFGTDAKSAKRMRSRIQDIMSTVDAEQARLLQEKYRQKLSTTEKILLVIPGVQILADWIEQSGKQYKISNVLLLSLLIFAGLFFIVLLLSDSFIFAVITSSVGFLLPSMIIRRHRNKRLELFEEQLPEALDIMSRAMKAGHPFVDTLKFVGEELKDPIGEEFYQTFSDINYGVDLKAAFMELLRRVPSMSMLTVTTAVLIQKTAGGNMTEILDKIASIVRGRFRFQRKVKTLSAEGRLSAWILTLEPFVLILGLWAIAPEYIELLFNEEKGRQLLLFAFVWMMVGTLLIRRIIKIDV